VPLFGDPHQHSIHSDGLGGAEAVYRRARRDYGQDFTALTDHESFVNKALGPLSWRYQCELADAFYEPGRFVTLRAYEFTGTRLPGPGHKCVYFGERVPEVIPPKDGEALLRLLREYGGIAVPHHVGWTGGDRAHHDPALQPVWEICSVHGAYEHGGAQRIAPRPDVVLQGEFVDDALAAGLRFGFVGGSDNHGLRWHHGVGRRPDALRCGLTAAFAEPTRDALLDALRARRCYATSGARILLRVDVEGAPMGSELAVSRPEVFVAAIGTAPIASLSLIVDGREVLSERGGRTAELRHRLEIHGPSYCYARVLQEDGEMAWSSPVWFDPT
jgi:hypothetical protein